MHGRQLCAQRLARGRELAHLGLLRRRLCRLLRRRLLRRLTVVVKVRDLNFLIIIVDSLQLHMSLVCCMYCNQVFRFPSLYDVATTRPLSSLLKTNWRDGI